MTNETYGGWPPRDPQKLAGQFRRLGWIGFWIQLAMLVVPVALLLYVLFGQDATSAQRKGIDLGNYLSYGSLIVMVFTTFWFWRYTRLARKIADPATCPPLSKVSGTLWTGLWAGSIGIFFSMVLLFGAAIRLLTTLLANPQTGMMVAPGPGADPSLSISAFDGISLTSLVMILAAELVVMGFTLWLLFRTTRVRGATADPG